MKLEGVLFTRRQLLGAISIAAGSVAATFAAVPIVGFLLSPMLRKYPGEWEAVGKLERFEKGATVQVNLKDSAPYKWDGATANVATWLRRNDETNFTCYSAECTHLGCPVRWIPSAELFMCPCHGGVYYKNGDVAAGPPPLPLQQYPVRVRDGVVEIKWQPERVDYSKVERPCQGCQQQNGKAEG